VGDGGRRSCGGGGGGAGVVAKCRRQKCGRHYLVIVPTVQVGFRIKF